MLQIVLRFTVSGGTTFHGSKFPRLLFVPWRAPNSFHQSRRSTFLLTRLDSPGGHRFELPDLRQSDVCVCQESWLLTRCEKIVSLAWTVLKQVSVLDWFISDSSVTPLGNGSRKATEKNCWLFCSSRRKTYKNILWGQESQEYALTCRPDRAISQSVTFISVAGISPPLECHLIEPSKQHFLYFVFNDNQLWQAHLSPLIWRNDYAAPSFNAQMPQYKFTWWCLVVILSFQGRWMVMAVRCIIEERMDDDGGAEISNDAEIFNMVVSRASQPLAVS